MTQTSESSYDPAGEVVDLCRDLIRIDTTNYGDGSGPGERKAAELVATLLDEVGIESEIWEAEPGRTNVVARWGGSSGSTADPLLLHGHLDVVPADADDWAVDPVLRRDPGRHGLGSRRRRHEGLRRDAALLGAGPGPGRRRAGPAAGPLLHRRRGGRRAPGRRAARRAAPRPARGLPRGDRRGRRLLGHRARAPDVPDRGGREGHGLDAADRHRQRRARLDGPPRQRRHPPGRRRRADRSARVAGAADPDHGGAAGRGRRPGRHRGHAGERPRADRGVRPGGTDARCGHQEHRQPDPAPGRLQGQRRARERHAPTSTAASCPATRTSSWPPWPSWPDRGSRSTSRRRCPASRRRTTGRWPRR